MRLVFHSRLVLFAALLVVLGCSSTTVNAQAVGPGDVLFNEFRLAGPGGFADEYIEFYCNRDTDCDISGYNLISFDPNFEGGMDFAIVFPTGVIIPARSYLLIGDDAGYTLSTYAALDLVASFGGEADFFIDNQGLQLRNADQTVIIDSVGFIGGGGTVQYIEGTGLQQASGPRPADQYAYVRKLVNGGGGRPQDSNNNANDFVLVSVTGAAHPGITEPPVLGAPGPQNSIAPLERNADTESSLVEPNQPSSAAPNRVRTGSGNSGTISIRRSFTNNTGQDIVFLIFRVIDITTLNSPGYSPGGPQADLRLITSGDAETFVNSQGRTVTIRGTVLEFDDGVNEPNQPNGGGLNSSVSVPVTVAAGETVDVQFLLNVVQAGRFRFFVNVEAATGEIVEEIPGVDRPSRGSQVLQPRSLSKTRVPFIPSKLKTAAPVKTSTKTLTRR
ncbi:MAG TPA: lamin tail domain-containing protein [Pyrinomonadaceae bacterium]